MHRAVERVGDARRAHRVAGRAAELAGRIRDRRIDVGERERRRARRLGGDQLAARRRRRRAPRTGTTGAVARPAMLRRYSRSARAAPRARVIAPARPVEGGGAVHVHRAGGARGVRAGGEARRELVGALLRVGDAVHLNQRLHGEELALGRELAVRELAAVRLERRQRARRRGRQLAAAGVDERDLPRQRVVRRHRLGRRARSATRGSAAA